jgi:hypothetical protein
MGGHESDSSSLLLAISAAPGVSCHSWLQAIRRNLPGTFGWGAKPVIWRRARLCGFLMLSMAWGWTRPGNRASIRYRDRG